MKRLNRLFGGYLIYLLMAPAAASERLNEEIVTLSAIGQSLAANEDYKEFIADLPVALPTPHFFYDNNFVKEVTDPVFIRSLKHSALIAGGITWGVSCLFFNNWWINDPQFLCNFKNMTVYLVSFYFSLALVHPIQK